MVPQRIAQRVVAGGATECLDVIVLIKGGDALGSQLPPDPVCLLENMHALPATRSGQRRGHSARAAADHKDITRDLARLAQAADRNYCNRRIAVDGHPHHVNQSVQRILHCSPLSGPSCSATKEQSGERL